MNLTLIKDALETSLNLLHDEFEAVIVDDVKENYLSAIKKIENALKLLDKNESTSPE